MQNSLRGFHSGGKDIVKIEAAKLTMLNQLACETNCSILLIHHISKTSANQERHNRAAGSFAMQACSEATIVVERFRELPEDDPARLVSIRGRHLRGLQAVLCFRETTLDFDLVMDGPASEDYPDLLQLWAAFPGTAFDAKAVRQELGWAPATIYRLMAKLTGAGVLIKESRKWTWDQRFTVFSK